MSTAVDTDDVQITEVTEYHDGYGILASATIVGGILEGTDEYEVGFSVYKDETDWVPQVGQQISVEGVGTITGITYLAADGIMVIDRSPEQALIARKIRQAQRLIAETEDELQNLYERYSALGR